MSPRITLAFTRRVLAQLRRDPRTIALMLVVPCVLQFLLQQLFGRDSPIFQQVGTPLLGLFPFITMFLVTSITMLRERTSGTLERLMTMPLHEVDLLAGYAIAFALVAVVQATLVSLLAFGVLPLTYAYDALARTAADDLGTRFAVDVAVVLGCIVLAVALGAATLRRGTD